MTATCSMKPFRYALQGRQRGTAQRHVVTTAGRAEGHAACGRRCSPQQRGRLPGGGWPPTLGQAGGRGGGAGPNPTRRRGSLWLVVRRQPDHHPALRLMEVDHTDLQDSEVWLVGLEASYKAL